MKLHFLLFSGRYKILKGGADDDDEFSRKINAMIATSTWRMSLVGPVTSFLAQLEER